MWTTTDLIDDEAIERRRHIGTIASADGYEHLTIDVVRRDDLTPTHNGYTVNRGRTEISIAGMRLLTDDTRRLASVLITAADDAETDNAPTLDEAAGDHRSGHRAHIGHHS